MNLLLKLPIFTFLVFTLLALPLLAAPDETQEATSSQEIKEKIRQRLEKTASESGQPQEIKKTTPSKYYAWVGTLKKVENEKLTVTTDEGERTAVVDEKTVILQNEKGKSRKEVKVENLKIDNFIIVMGVWQKPEAEQELKAVRIICSPPETVPEKELVSGKVSEVDEEKIKLDDKEKTVLPIGKKTTIKINGSVKEAKLADIQLEDRIFALVIMKDDKISEAKAVFVLPGKNNPQATVQPSAPADGGQAEATAPASPQTQISPSPKPEED